MDAREIPKRSAKYRSVPATAPQLPATEVFETRHRGMIFGPIK